MTTIPHDGRLDATLAFRRDPYRFISRRARELRSEVFACRILLQRTVCMTGRDAAESFYDEKHFLRHGAVPTAIRKTLFGSGGVQGLDGPAHRHRKRMFLELMTPDRVEELADRSTRAWREVLGAVDGPDEVELYALAQEVFARAVCDWAGVPLREAEVPARTRDLTAMFDAAGTVGLRHFGARRARRRSERWAAGLIARTRAEKMRPGEDTALHRIATHRTLDDRLLEPEIAAVELLNVLRPTVAIAVFAVDAAHALYWHPEWRARLQSGDAAALHSFAQEVRRYYPFFPAVTAVVRDDFTWHGMELRGGTWAFLDLYGTDHDPAQWVRPDEFLPERFEDRDVGLFELVPQGGGDHAEGHRCAGEPVTVALLERAAHFLAAELDYTVPEQDTGLDFGRLPALPKDGFRIRDVKLRAPHPAAL